LELSAAWPNFELLIQQIHLLPSTPTLYDLLVYSSAKSKSKKRESLIYHTPPVSKPKCQANNANRNSGMNQEWYNMDNLLQHWPTLTNILRLDSHTWAPRCNAPSRKTLHSLPRQSTRFIQAHWMSHAGTLASTKTSSTNHGTSETSTTNLTISILQNYVATPPNFSSNDASVSKLCVTSTAFQGCHAHSHTLCDDSNLQSVLQITPHQLHDSLKSHTMR
jgi:hypothetical protein